MAKTTVLIQERELRFWHAWMHREAGTLRKLLARDYVMVFGTDPIEVLDRPSFVAGVPRDFLCEGYRIGEGVVRRYGKMALYIASADLELTMGSQSWNGRFLITGLWRKFTFGGWKLAERSVSQLSDDQQLAQKIQRLQMWQR